MARSASDIMAELDRTMLKPKKGVLDDVRKTQQFKPTPAGTIIGKPKKKKEEASTSKKGTGGQPWWMDALNFAARPQRALTGGWAEAAKSRGIGDFISRLPKVAQAEWRGLTGKEKVDFDQVMNNLGWKDKKGFGLHDVVSFAGDVLADPLTYVTLGAGSAIKAGAKAATKVGVKAAADTTKKTGVKIATKDLRKVPRDIYNAKRETLVAKGVRPELAARVATLSMNKAKTAITSAGKAARNKAQNALINVDVPFTKLTAQFGKKPKVLQKVEAKVGVAGATAVTDMLNKLGLTDGEQKTFLKKTYNIDKPGEMNTQMLRHLQDHAGKYEQHVSRYAANDGALKANLRNHKVTDEVAGYGQKVDYKKFDPAEFIGALGHHVVDPRLAERIAPLIHGLGGNVDQLRKAGPEAVRMFGEALGKMPGTIKGKTAASISQDANLAADALGKVDNVATVSDDLTDPILKRVVADAPNANIDESLRRFSPDEFVQDMGGKSRFGQKILPRAFNARSLGKDFNEGVLNNAAAQMRNTENEIYGKSRVLDTQLKGLRKQAESFSPEQLQSVAHLIEEDFPKGFDQSVITPEVRDMAKSIKQHLGNIATDEMGVGVLDKLRKGYFPHVVNFSNRSAEDYAKLLQDYGDDEAFKNLISKSQGNVFNKSREGFQTLAQADNYVADLAKKLEDPKLSDMEREALTEKRDVVSNLFERNPIDALAKRYNKSFKSRAMKNMYKQFNKDGLLKSAKEFTASPELARNGKDYHSLTMTEANGLGLKKGDYLHKEVFEALKKTDGIFTDKGVDNWLSKAESIQNIWKTLVTSAVPSHYINNFIGNVFNNSLAGVKLGDYKDSVAILKRFKNNKMTVHDMDIITEAFQNGILHTGSTADFTKATEELGSGKLAKAEKWVRDNAYTSFMRKNGGERVDNMTRLALFVHGKKTTGDVGQAAEMVRKHLFNYHEMTQADRTMRVFIPFWNWMKNNIPLQIEKLAQQPRFYQTYQRLKNNSQGDDKAAMPDWMSEAYLKVPGTDKRFYNPRLPLSDLNGVLSGPMDALRTAANAFTPFAKVPAEVLLNKSFFTGNPIDYDREYKGEVDPKAWLKYALQQLGGVNKVAAFGDGQGNIMSDISDLLFGKTAELKEAK